MTTNDSGKLNMGGVSAIKEITALPPNEWTPRQRDRLAACLTALAHQPSITTTVQGGMPGNARRAARRLAWERLARSLDSCVSASHRSSSAGPNRSRGSISRTTR